MKIVTHILIRERRLHVVLYNIPVKIQNMEVTRFKAIMKQHLYKKGFVLPT